MSFLIDWSLLTNGDGTEADNLLAFLNTRFQQIDRPPFLGPLAVTDFDFGDVPPEIKITDICDPSPEFYLPEEEDEWGRFVAGANAQAAAAAAGNGSGGVNTPPRPFSPGAEYGEGHFASRAFEHGIRHRGTGGGGGAHQQGGMYASEPARTTGGGYVGNNLGLISPPSIARTNTSPMGSARSLRGGGGGGSVVGYGTGWSGSVGLGLGLGLGASPMVAPPARTPSYQRSPTPSARTHTTSPSPRPWDLPYHDPYAQPPPPPPPRLTDHELALQYAQTMQRPSDAQVELQIVYKGNMRLGITTELIVNQPTPAFMVLPLNLTLTGFHFTATALISYLGDRINFCFKEADTGATILQDVSIDSEVGDGRKQVLKNVGRIERFIIDQLRKVIQDFLVFPNHQSLHLRPETEDDGYSERDGGSSGSSGDSGSWTGSEEGSEEG